MNYDAITEDIFVGTYFQPEEWAELQNLGVTCCINLMAEQRDQFPGHAEPAAAIWLPVPDWQGPDVDTLHLGVALIKGMREAGHRIYIHCLAGVGRSPTLAAAYLITTGLSASEALALVRRKRPRIDPNRLQIRMLTEFAASQGG